MQSPPPHNSSIGAIELPLFTTDEVDEFLDGMDVSTSPGDVLTGDTVLGHKSSGKAHGTASELLLTLEPGPFHQVAGCPFHAGPSPKGKGVSVAVSPKRDRLTVLCWAADEHNHPEDTVRYSADGRTYAVWAWGPTRKFERDTVPSDDQSVLADYVLRKLVVKAGLLAIRNEVVYVYDKQAGGKQGGKEHAGASPTWGAWAPLPTGGLVEQVRRILEKTSVRVTDKAGVESTRPVFVTVRLIGDVTTLLLRTLQMRERLYIERMFKRGDITYEEQEKAVSRFDFCTATLLNPGVVLTDEVVQEEARPDHHCPSDCRIGFAPDERFVQEWTAYVGQMIPDETDRVAFQMWMGAAVVGACATKLQQHVILKGRPGSGKSQLIELCASVFPESQRSSVSLAKMADRFSTAGLVGKRFNTSPEADNKEGKIPDVGSLKMFLDGSTVQVERKNKDPFWSRLIVAHLIAANTLPTGDTGEALYDRFRVIQCTETKMRREAGAVVEWWKTRLHWRPAILAWAVSGLALLKAANWRLPNSVASDEAAKEWREEGDSVLAWVHTLAPPPTDRKHWAPAPAAYNHYLAWCKVNGRGALSSTKFGRELKTHAESDRTGGRAYAITITAVDSNVQELFPDKPSPLTLLRAAIAVGDSAEVQRLFMAYPGIADEHIKGMES